MIIYLYKKTHNKTGLNYLGKTTSKDPFAYSGSGTEWKAHLKKHGTDIKTVILKECRSKAELNFWGRHYSKLLTVVESNEWANKIPESGGGDGSYWKDPVKANSAKLKISNTIKTAKLGKAYKQTGPDNHMYGKTGPKHHRYGKVHSEQTRNLLSKNHHDVSGCNNPRARKIKITTNSGQIFESCGNLKEVCNELGLSINTIYIMLSKGKNQFVKGRFKGYRVEYVT